MAAYKPVDDAEIALLRKCFSSPSSMNLLTQDATKVAKRALLELIDLRQQAAERQAPGAANDLTLDLGQ
jgi:hypothetical protein